jgi:hypothetical protein
MPIELPKTFKGRKTERREAIFALVFLAVLALLTTLPPRAPQPTPDQVRQQLLADIDRTR